MDGVEAICALLSSISVQEAHLGCTLERVKSDLVPQIFPHGFHVTSGDLDTRIYITHSLFLFKFKKKEK